MPMPGKYVAKVMISRHAVKAFIKCLKLELQVEPDLEIVAILNCCISFFYFNTNTKYVVYHLIKVYHLTGA